MDHQVGQKEQVPSPKSKVRGSGLLRQVIHLTLRIAHLAGVKEARRQEAGPDPAVQDEGALEERSSSGVDQ